MFAYLTCIANSFNSECIEFEKNQIKTSVNVIEECNDLRRSACIRNHGEIVKITEKESNFWDYYNNFIMMGHQLTALARYGFL